jgi:hypothetical protein
MSQDHNSSQAMPNESVWSLPRNRIPTAEEFMSAAMHLAVSRTSLSFPGACVALFDWMLVSDPDGRGVTIADAAHALATSAFGAADDLRRAIATALDEASEYGPFEQLDESTWRINPKLQSDKLRRNAALLALAASRAGWDIIIPGSGYDFETPFRPPDQEPSLAAEVVVAAGPDGPLDTSISVTLANGATTELEWPAERFFYLDNSLSGQLDQYEIAFENQDLDAGYSAFTIRFVKADEPWGFPDFRDPLYGWVSCVGSSVACAWAFPLGDDEAHGVWQESIDALGGLDKTAQAYWVTVARAVMARLG